MAIELTTAATGQISGIKASLFLDNVENTSDLNKPVSTAQQAYITGVSGVLQTTIDGLDASNHVTYNSATGDVNLGVHKIVATTGEFTNLDISSNIVVGGTVDGRDVAADGAIIDGLGTISTFNSGDYLNTARTATYTPTADYHPSTKKYVDDHAAVSATTTTKGHVELATNTEAHAATDTTRAVTPSNLLIKKDGTAIVAGDLTGNSRGSNALDVQSGRSSATKVASGATSSAVGYSNTASGGNSNAFGFSNTASGYYCSAVGYNNTASGDYSSAFGYFNTASGSESSSVGKNNIASAYYSSALGYNNTASGDYSSAFGYFNTASGSESSSVGKRNNTQGTNSSLFGNANREIGTATWSKNSLFGYDNEVTSSGSGLSIQNLTVVGYQNSWTQNSSINGATAVGYSNEASGSRSNAVGYNNTVSGDSSSAFGYNNTVSGNYGCAAFGYQNTVSGPANYAVGRSNTASGSYGGSSAVGYNNTASGFASSAFGYSNTASGGNSNAVGYFNTASGENSSAFGYKNTTSTINSAVFGRSNFVSTGDASVALGILNNQTGGTINTTTGVISGTPAAAACGDLSTAVGVSNKASGNISSAIGYNNTASGNASSAVGNGNTVSGNYGSSAFGYGNTASGGGSSAVGKNNTASGTTSFAVGYNNNASGNYIAAFGYGNTVSGNYAASAFGCFNTASSNYSSAFGHYNTSSGYSSSAFGFLNTASGNSSSAFGYRNTASGNYSSSVGRYTKTTVDFTFEAGYWSSPTIRVSAIRMHPNGQVAMTIEDSASAPTDGGATAGSEADGTLPRGMVAFRKNGADLYVDSNTSGTVSTLGLGILQSARVYSPRFIQSFVTGSGAARLSGQASADTCSLQTGATTGSTAGASIGGNVALINGAALDGDNANVINFSRKQSCLFKFATNASASCTGWIFWGGPFNNVWTGGPTGKSIGLKLDGNALKLVAHDGSSATTGSSILTMTANITYEILIVADGSGNLEAFRNGTSLGTITGAPTGSTAAPVYPSAQAVIENNATTTNANLQVLGIDILAGELQ